MPGSTFRRNYDIYKPRQLKLLCVISHNLQDFPNPRIPKYLIPAA